MSILYTNGKWKTVKRKKKFSIYRGRKLIDSDDTFHKAYDLLNKHKKEY